MKAKLFSVILFVACALFVGCEKDYEQDGKDGFLGSYPSGAVQYPFNVSMTKKVAFAKGNLCYFSKENAWRIASEQWYLSNEYLFQWGNVSTPYTIGKYSKDYKNLDNKSDWGKACTIDNIDETKHWRCLTSDEWQYLVSHNKTEFGTITSANDVVYGLFIIPQELKGEYFSADLSMSEWKTWESKGVVFLPAKGYKDSNGEWQNVSSYDYYDHNNSRYHRDIAYWTASLANDENAFVFACYSDNSNRMPYINDSYFVMSRSSHCSVRLVYDLN